MPTRKATIGIGAGTVIGMTSGFVGLRLIIRSLVEETLVKDYNYDKIVDTLQKQAGMNLNLPPARAFARALVPLWDLSTPYTAIEDILAKGRKSQYWPPRYRKTPKGGEKVEKAIFRAMRAAYYAPPDTSSKELTQIAVVAAANALLSKG